MAIHAAAAAALLAFGIPSAVTSLHPRALQLTLIAPAPAPAPKPISRPLALAAAVPAAPRRVFHAPVLSSPVAAKPSIELLPAPAIALPRPAAPAPVPELPRIAPPVITGSFAETAVAAPVLLSRHAGSAGFGDASPVAGSAAAGRPAVTGGFGDAEIETPRAPVFPSSSAVATSPVEILDKPRPAYTPEARRLAIEGEVLLEVSFEASGQARVLRLIRGLGHGLDETAIDAARGIRFRPASRQGIPVDSAAVVHILFQLAY